MRKNTVTYVLDRSGSMETIKQDTIDLFNKYVDGVRDVADLTFNLILFDTYGTDKLYDNVPVKQVEPLTALTYDPRGGTPLVDTMHDVLVDLLENFDSGDRVLFVTHTDGQERDSSRHTMAQVHELIRQVYKRGWQVIFLGANVDAYQDSRNLGIRPGATMSYNAADRANAGRISEALASNTRSYVASHDSSASVMDWTEQQKAEAGDKFRPKG